MVDVSGPLAKSDGFREAWTASADIRYGWHFIAVGAVVYVQYGVTADCRS